MAITLSDINKMAQVFATKDDLRELRDEIRENFVTNERFDAALGKLDYIIGELQTMRQERVFGEQRFQDLEEETESLDHRVKKIEELPSIASHLK